MSDDGANDPQKIRAVALAKGLVKEQELESYDDEKLLNLIFVPGFSTSAQVTDLSDAAWEWMPCGSPSRRREAAYRLPVHCRTIIQLPAAGCSSRRC